MEIVTAFIGSTFGKIALSGVGLGLLVKIAKDPIRQAVTRALNRGLVLVLDPKTEDPVLRDKIIAAARANIAVAEHLIPDRGTGAAKKAMVLAALSKMMPLAPAQVLSDLIEEVFSTSDDILKGVNAQK